jgi:hypothetical protein
MKRVLSIASALLLVSGAAAAAQPPATPRALTATPPAGVVAASAGVTASSRAAVTAGTAPPPAGLKAAPAAITIRPSLLKPQPGPQAHDSREMALPATHAAASLAQPALPAAPPRVGRLEALVHGIKNVGLQAGGTAVGFGEKALGKFSPDLTGPYQPVEVKDPSGTRSLVVFRSNQAKSVDDIASFVDLARQRGATSPSQIAFVNLRSEKDEDRSLIAAYQATQGPGGAPIKQVDVKIIDNGPPAFYLGPIGWNKAVDQVRQVYQALKDPSVKVAVIHCEQGHGRTGEIVATAVRIAMDGMSGPDAVAEAEQHGLTMPWQRAFIERFAREWQAGKISLD